MSLGRASPVLAFLFIGAGGACSTAGVAEAPEAPEAAVAVPDATDVDTATIDSTFTVDSDGVESSDDAAVVADAPRDAADDAKPPAEASDALGDGDTATAPFVPPPGCAVDAGASDAAVPDIGEAGIGDGDVLPAPTWRAVAKLNFGRSDHFAFPVVGGRVLVVGGYGIGSSPPPPLPQELYDPLADKWTANGDPPAPTRAPSAAVLLADGRVLAIVPEDFYPSPHQPRYTRVYDPKFHLWTDVALASLCNPGLVRLASGRVLAAGGACTLGGAGVPAGTSEFYDPVADAWTPAASMHVARRSPLLLRLADDRVLAVGGDGAGNAEVYDEVLDRWTLLPASPFGAVAGAAGPLPSGKVLFALPPPPAPGGASDAPTPFALFDPICGAWSRTAWMPTTITDEALIVDHAGHVVTAGGSGHHVPFYTPAARATGVYDESLDRWTLLPPSARAPGGSVTLLDSGAIMIAGGSYGCGKMCIVRSDAAFVLDAPP